MMQKKKEKPLRFLLVEDNQDHALIVMSALKKFNPSNSAIHLLNGEKAIEYLSHVKSSAAPELIILDIKMPRKNGFEVLDFIRQKERTHIFQNLLNLICSQNL